MNQNVENILNLAKAGLLPKEAAELLLAQAKQIEEMSSVIEASRNTIRDSQLTIRNQHKEIEYLRDLIREKVLLSKMANSEKFASSSEQMLLDLFNDAEVISRLEEKEDGDEKITIKEHTRKIKPRSKTCKAPADAPVIDIDHTEGCKDSFIKDGILYKRVEDKIINKAAIVPAKMIVERHHYAQYKAEAETEGDEPGTIIKWDNRKTDGLGASPSMMADIIISKFDDHLPLFRQEERLSRDGYYFSRQKMASWLISFYELIIPLIDEMKKAVYSSRLICKDETRLQVLDVKNSSGKPSTNSFMNVTIGRTYVPEERRCRTLVVFDYTSDRKNDTLMDDYNRYGFKGYAMTDGLKGYLQIEDSRHAVCWVHAVRQFKKICKVDNKNKHVNTILRLFGKLYSIEDKERSRLLSGESSPEQFLSSRKEKAKKVIDVLLSYALSIRAQYTEGSAVGKAIDYLITYQKNLYVYLDIVECTPDNNISENAIRPMTVGRKNWLFSQSVDGADASSAFYSLVETAKLSDIPVREYLEHILTEAPKCRRSEDWQRLLPWKADLSKARATAAKRAAAAADPSRADDYLFSGVSGVNSAKSRKN